MSAVLVIARNVVRESLRRRILYLILLFVLALLLMAESVSRFEAQVQLKMVKDFSYTIVSFFGLALTMLVTFDQVPVETESRTIYLVLSRPVPRWAFLLGKLLGVIGVLLTVMAFMGAAFILLAGFNPGKGFSIDAQVLQAIHLLMLKYSSYAALLMFFSIVLSRPVAVVLSLLVYFYGHVSDFLHLTLGGADSRVFDLVLRTFDLVMPNYAVLDFPSGVVRAELFTWQSLAILTAYALSFTLLYLALATWAFATKEL